MLQTVIILIGKYKLKDDVLFVINQRVFYTTTTACSFWTFNSATNIFLCPQIFPFCPHFFNPKGSLSPTVKIHGRTLQHNFCFTSVAQTGCSMNISTFFLSHQRQQFLTRDMTFSTFDSFFQSQTFRHVFECQLATFNCCIHSF